MQDSNLRPPAPKAGALTGLRQTPNIFMSFLFDYKIYVRVNSVFAKASSQQMAERAGFEPAVPRSEYVSLANWWFKPLTHLSCATANIELYIII